MTGDHTIAVVIPAHRAGAELQRAVHSATTQSLSPDEVLVIDNSAAGDIAGSLGPVRGRFQVHRENRLGKAHARNMGLQVARSAFCAFLDSDDEWSPHFLADMASAIARYPEAGMFVGAAIVHTRDGAKRVPAPRFGNDPFCQLLLRNPISTSATVVNRVKAIGVGGFPADLYAEDWALWLRISRSYPVVPVDSTPVFRYEYGDSVRRRGDPAFYDDMNRILESVLSDNSPRRARRIARAGISMHRGTHLLRRGERAEARRLFWMSARLCPSSLEVWRWVGMSHVPASLDGVVRACARGGRSG